MKEFSYIIDEEYHGERIDKYLSQVMEGKSRSFIQGLIDEGKITVNDKIVKSNHKLKKNDLIKGVIPDPVELKVEAEDIPLDILYEDEDVIVVNKPQGMVVHPAAGNTRGTLVNAILNHCKDLSGINGVIRPGIVHRIDKDTSGVLVIAKNDASHNKLAEQLKDHSMTRVYIALVEGVIKNDRGTVDANLGRHPIDRKKMAVVKDGRRAVTHYKVLERLDKYTLVECRLETGRTHQIRVHMAYIGHPLVGDPVYGFKKQKFNLDGQLLHAKILGFIHPTTGKYIEFQTPLPDYFKRVLEILRK
ncbi:MAG: RluA family pseudouridine synthase [Clostridiales bacterium]|uniref:RluA family pseudouridine synthase n=1 Tax=Clostridium sp. N3C TaxID=1776758 RepID=UPI00092DEB8F|nr:RluA family pseudouridine synthase [Clostridium sp. N3C]NLZ47342.1 RluA family pseudouridine synthase [Clostridiales bacterium]SCN21356.1 Ribosomal large subunit pseudouridine synthase D [Clostridium sp. N3C]